MKYSVLYDRDCRILFLKYTTGNAKAIKENSLGNVRVLSVSVLAGSPN